MIGVRYYSSQTRSFPRRLATRLARLPEGAPHASGWKLWAQRLFGSSKPRMARLQDALVRELGLTDRVTRSMVQNELHQLHFHNPQADIKTPTLLVHGHAASAMAFHRNFAGLSSAVQDLYAVDLPSNGLSVELPLELELPPPLPLRIQLQNDTFKLPYTIEPLHQRAVVQGFENYYLDALEQWRLDNKLGRINVVAHSYGGYLSFKYAAKYPHAVAKLCLVSPLGVERNAFAVDNRWSSNTAYPTNYTDPASKYYIPSRPAIPKLIFESQTRLLRALGPLGAKLCWNYIAAAYSRVPSVTYKQYVFEMFYGKDGLSQTSRDIFTGLFTNRLLARDPLLNCLEHLRVKDLMLLYGDRDWMNRTAGQQLAQEANSIGITADYNEVSSSGHNLFLDNPEEFNQRVVQFLDE
ncbi:LAME_0G08284g1_1 [Lachancea meyersii CBS 8951]|uniref:LAME_0G08284g1_1 n=1 Tax=Lachancea meyersii CBS 8951 TaxID=1266667 RepID=A0A1G4K863_9SACH|nr:LAME_0G08284g1_1 [Lachancea meyersii CBS 8951]